MLTNQAHDWQELLKFRCTGCGNCCKKTIVMLTDSDVLRIVGGTNTAARSFVRFFGEDEVKMPRRHPFWVRLANRRVTMGLRWVRERCVFLDAENRCTIYDHRPLACREHPFKITMSDTGAVTGLSLSRIVECLYELDGQLKRRDLAAVSRWNVRESEQYQARVKIWNRSRRGSRTRASFMEFLGLDWDRASP